jgi:hypothetical protein
MGVIGVAVKPETVGRLVAAICFRVHQIDPLEKVALPWFAVTYERHDK